MFQPASHTEIRALPFQQTLFPAMYISAARINNYKSIYDSGDIPFTPRFNVIVGRNDAGKSALVEALGLRYALKPHRSLKTALTAVTPLEQISSTHITFNLSPEDIIEFLSGQQLVYIPVTAGEDQPVIDQFTKAIAEAGTFQFVWTPNGIGSAWLERYGDSAKPNFLQCNNSAYPYGLNLVANGRVSGSVGHYGLVIAGVLLTRIYGFRAERLNVGESNVTGNAVLLQNAANLPDVLNQQSRPTLYGLSG